ncbi:MAG: FAD-dependent oxidoreductase [Bacillota bacterium]|nr:FAD-dependent oxidoreductase [Bacillota bacterium]
MKSALQTIEHNVDICVVGGGLAGLCAAVSAARHGVRVLIMQDRPMFGGNASSEVRMWVSGAHGENNRETGLVEEIMLESFYRNPYSNYSLWDSILFEKVRFQEGLDYLLNCSCLDAEMAEDRINSIRGWQLTTQTYHQVRAKIFIDCSGDSILAPLTGAEYRVGRESNREFGEDIAPDQADRRTMGMSCLIQAREHAEKCTYTPPFWAEKFSKEKLPHRLPHPKERNENYWYLELGGEHDSIADTEKLRDELQNVAYGIWDYVKNSGDYGPEVDRLDVDWIGILPGKRESRRYVGDVIMNQNDVRSEGRFDDLVAYGGWTMDDHHPGGLRSPEKPTIFHPAPSPFGIPYRSLYSVNVANLMFAGRNISVTHSALSATRVMATCATIGQASGTAAALAVQHDTTPRGVYEKHLQTLQTQLMEDDCYLPFHQRPIPTLTLTADLVADGQNAENLRNGFDRPIGTSDNGWTGHPGDPVTYWLANPAIVKKARFIFDSDLNRLTLPEDPRHNRPQRSNHFLDDKPMHVPATLIRNFRIDVSTEEGKWQTFQTVTGNHQRLVSIDLSPAGHVTAVRFIPQATWGSPACHVFSFDITD